jgi:hypothetical protein
MPTYYYKMNIWKTIHEFIAELMGIELYDEPDPAERV